MGNLQLNVNERKKLYRFNETGYCFEEVDLGIWQGRKLFLCSPEEDNNMFIKINLVLSSVCLALTILGYMCVPKMHNLHGKILISYCLVMFLLKITIVVVHLYPVFDNYMCVLIGK